MNEAACKDAKKVYTSSMNDWLEGEKPFATLESLTKHHQDTYEFVTNHLNANLKGPNDFTEHFLTQLKQVCIYIYNTRPTVFLTIVLRALKKLIVK